jgi:competence protein ComEC
LLLLLALCLSALAGDLKVHILDVGQGDSVLIEAPSGKHILVDAGTSGAGVDQLLRRRGIERLDMIIATHPHADHIGGMLKVMNAVDVGMFMDNGMTHTTLTYARTMAAVEAKEIPYRAGLQGRIIDVGDRVNLTLLHPRTRKLKGTRSDLNSNSVVIRIDHKKDCILLMGDAEEPTERSLMKHGIEPCEVLKVAHHGSAHSTSMEWLQAIKPKIALISVGEGNRYRHPAQDTLNRLERSGAETHRTDLEGTITIVSTGRGVRVESERSTEQVALRDVLTTQSPVESDKKKKRKKFRFFQWLFGKKNKTQEKKS